MLGNSPPHYWKKFQRAPEVGAEKQLSGGATSLWLLVIGYFYDLNGDTTLPVSLERPRS